MPQEHSTAAVVEWAPFRVKAGVDEQTLLRASDAAAGVLHLRRVRRY